MEYIFLFYCFLSIVLITGGGFYFYSSAQEVTAALYFIGSVVAALFFGFRWFSSSGNVQIVKAGAWPPVVNYCPDFLTLATVQGEQVCIDTVGVAQAGGIEISDGTQVSDKYLFHLFLDKSGPTRVTSLCDQAKTKQVTWEGVWDGTVCVGIEPPKPSTS